MTDMEQIKQPLAKTEVSFFFRLFDLLTIVLMSDTINNFHCNTPNSSSLSSFTQLLWPCLDADSNSGRELAKRAALT